MHITSGFTTLTTFEMDYSVRSIAFAACPMERGKLVCGFGREKIDLS